MNVLGDDYQSGSLGGPYDDDLSGERKSAGARNLTLPRDANPRSPHNQDDVEARRPPSVRLSKSWDDSGLSPQKPEINTSLSNREVHRQFRKEVLARKKSEEMRRTSRRSPGPSPRLSAHASARPRTGSDHNPRVWGFGPVDADGDVSAPRGSKLVSSHDLHEMWRNETGEYRAPRNMGFANADTQHNMLPEPRGGDQKPPRLFGRATDYEKKEKPVPLY